VDANDILPFIKATRHIFQTMFQLAVEVGTPELRKGPAAGKDVSAIIGMSGDVEGSVVLSFSMDTARRIVAVFTGTDAAVSNEDLADAVGEIVNMIAGGAKAQFKNKNVSISCPSVVIGEQHRVLGGKDIACVSIPCTCDCGSFSVDIATRQDSKSVLPSLSVGASAA
jgi:chemotaxis protein CheX